VEVLWEEVGEVGLAEANRLDASEGLGAWWGKGPREGEGGGRLRLLAVGGEGWAAREGGEALREGREGWREGKGEEEGQCG
jgi:hypothetical protein